jgi:hypothetical protein
MQDYFKAISTQYIDALANVRIQCQQKLAAAQQKVKENHSVTRLMQKYHFQSMSALKKHHKAIISEWNDRLARTKDEEKASLESLHETKETLAMNMQTLLRAGILDEKEVMHVNQGKIRQQS